MLVGDHLVNNPAKFEPNWPSDFRRNEENGKTYILQTMGYNSCLVMAAAHLDQRFQYEKFI